MIGNKLVRTSISLLLASTLLLDMLPISVSQAEQPQPFAVQKDRDASFSAAPAEKKELTEYRTLNSKRFLNPDGSFTEQIFGRAIHYKDNNGLWQTVDSSLVVDEKGNYRNKANRFLVNFKSVANAGFLDISNNGTTLSFRPKFAGATKASVKGAEVLYENITGNTDLRYKVSANGVKEDILLKGLDSATTYSFELKADNLTWQQQEDGSVQFFQNGKTESVFNLQKPYMVDAARHFSTNVSYKISKDNNGRASIDVVADPTWIQDPKRVFPVVIDPTVRIEGISEMEDTFVEENRYEDNFEYYSNNLIGYCVDHKRTRPMYKFNLKSLPSGAVISDASFSVYNNATYEPDIRAAVVDLYPYQQPWDVYKVTWESESALLKGNVASSYTLTTGPGWWKFPIKTLVQDWYNGYLPNYGFKLQYRDETQVCRELTSIDDPIYGDAQYGPYVDVQFAIDGLGQQPYWTYDGPVNMDNRNLVVGATDISFPGRQTNVVFGRTYNSRANYNGYLGYGWSSALNMKVYISAKGPARFVDGQGTVHYFNQKADGTYEPLSGLHWKLSVSGTSATITTTEQTVYTFANGQLINVQDAAGNGLTYSYTSNLIKIADGAGYTINVNLSGGRVVSADDPAGRRWTYSYDGSGNLVRVKLPDGASTVYRYDDKHNLIGAVSEEGRMVYYRYNDDD